MEMTINHSSHLIPQQVGQFQSGQRGGPATNLGYTDSYSNIKYESLDGSDNQSVGNEFIGNGQHSMSLDSPKSFFDNDYFDLPENLSNPRMNGVVQSVSQDRTGLEKISHHNRASRSSDDRSSNGEVELMSNGGGKMMDKRHVRGRASNLDRKRPYPCKVCPSKFGSKMELEEHQNSHTGQKPFECEVCNSRFNRRSTLWNHKRIHSDAKPFQCSVCNMQFKWKNSLKCHKEMHVRKNETTVAVDNEIRQLTYATAAKRRLLEMEGSDSSKASSMTIFSAASTSSEDSQQAKGSGNGYNMPMSSDQQYNQPRKKSRVKKEALDDNEILEGSMLLPDQQQLSQQLIENSILGNMAMDLNIDTQTNLDFMNNQLLMQAICSTDSDQSCNQNDLRSNSQQNCNSLFGMEDSSKMLPGSLLDIKDSLSLQSPVSNSATSINMLPFLKPIINVNVNVDFNQLGTLNDNPSSRQQQLPTISHFTSSSGASDYGNDSLSNGHFHGCHASGASTTSSSSTPSSNGHHRYGEMNYNQQTLDHSLLLSTAQHGNNDYMNAFDYMMPAVTSTGNPNYSNVDIPLSAFANDHNLISADHNLISPHSTRMMIYHGIEHHPNCMNSQMSAGQLR